tara:strand:- start:347 stop:1030 length:684 start_codon:yes stop_codon:yes gene_type:complete
MTVKKKQPIRRQTKPKVDQTSKHTEIEQMDKFKEGLKTEIIGHLSKKLDDGFDRMFERLSKQFVSREEYEHEQHKPSHDPMILPANNNDSKMPDLSGLADMVQNMLPSQSSPSQDIASPQDQTQPNPMGNMMGNPIMQMIMQSILKPDQATPNNLFNPAMMNELIIRSFMDSMNLQSQMNKAFMQKVLKNEDLPEALKTHGSLMNPLENLGSKQEARDKESGEKNGS